MPHLAEINVARALAPLDDPMLAPFMVQIAAVNELADRSPGFVWRLQTEYGDATGIQAFDDPRVLVNMSVWRDVDSLWRFTYDSGHLAPFRERRRWFEPPTQPHLALWWIPEGRIPTLDEGRARLEHLVAHGPTPFAFTFKQMFDEQGAPMSRERPIDPR